MVLSDFLSALKTPSIKVTLLNTEDVEIIKFFIKTVVIAF